MPRPSTRPRYSLNTPPTTPSKAQASPSQSPAPTTPTKPLIAETPYHKKMKQLLTEHRKLRKEWIGLVLGEGSAHLRGVSEKREEIENAFASLSHPTPNTAMHRHLLVTDYILGAFSKLTSQIDLVQSILKRLMEMVRSMVNVVDQLEALLIATSKSRGVAYTFSSPAWLTWPFSRFVDRISELTDGYLEQTSLLQSLSDILTPNDTLFDLEDKQEKTELETMQIQAAMSYWVTVPQVRIEDEIDFEEACSSEWSLAAR